MCTGFDRIFPDPGSCWDWDWRSRSIYTQSKVEEQGESGKTGQGVKWRVHSDRKTRRGKGRRCSVTRAGPGEPNRWRPGRGRGRQKKNNAILSLSLSPRLIPIPIPSHPIPPSSFLLPPPSPRPPLPIFSTKHPPTALPPLPSPRLGTTKRIYPAPTSSPDMGNCSSNSQDAEGKARSDMIDRQIEEDSKRYKRECKILLLGACATQSFITHRE